MKKIPTIIHIIDSLVVGGAEMLLINTIPLLTNYDHVVICLIPKEELKEQIQPYLKAYYQLEVTNKKKWVAGIIRIRKLIRMHRPAIVHAHLQLSSLFTRIACPANTALVYTIHSTFSEDAFKNNWKALFMERLTVKKRHSLVAVSKFVLDDYLRCVPFKGNTYILYNFVSSRFFENAKKNYLVARPGSLKLVAVGNLKEAKNYSYIIAAFKKLKQYPVQIDIYGEGPERVQLQQSIDEFELKVSLKGKTDKLEILLPGYDLYIISSKHEGYGIAPLEAMACGIPVLASDIPVLREVIGDNALFFDLNNPADLVQKIIKLIADHSILQGLSAKGRKRAAEIASKERYLEDINTIYTDITKQ